MYSIPSKPQLEPLDRRIILAMKRFESDKSTLALAIKEGEAIRNIIESEKIYSSNQFRYGKLPYLANARDHWELVREDLHYFCNVCGVDPIPDFAEACLLWRLKTGRSLAELSEDILTVNLEFHDGSWFSRNSEPKGLRGKIFSVLGLPAFGKSRFSAQLQSLGDFRLIDPDIFRFYTLAKEILAVDGELFDEAKDGKWLKTQHMYGPSIRNLLRVLFLSTTLTMAENGHDIIANGFVMVDEGHSDVVFWIESDDLTLEQFTSMSIPSLDSILRLQETSMNEEDFLSRIDSTDLKEIIKIISSKVEQRTEFSRSDSGDLDWETPTQQLILELQEPGANPKMNTVDIALKAAGIYETILQLKANNVQIICLKSEGIPSSDRLYKLLGIESSLSRLLSVTSPSKSRLPAIPIHDLANPKELYQARIDAIRDCEVPVLGLTELIDLEIKKLESPEGDGRSEPISHVVHRKCLQFLNGIASSARDNSVHKQVLAEVKSIDKHALLDLTANVFSYGLTTEQIQGGGYKYIWRGRWEPALKRNIPSPLHSIFIIPFLGMSMLGENYDVYRFIADISHDILEESIFHKEVKGSLQRGELYSKSSKNRSKLLNAFNNANKYGPYAAFCASIMGDTYTIEEEREIHQIIFPTITREEEQDFLKALGGVSLGQTYDSYSLRDGPVRDCLLSLQKRIAFTKMNKRLKESKDYTINSEMAGAISSSFRDKIENVLTLDRYLDPDFIDINPVQARAKVISYTGRLLASHSMMMETYLTLSEELQIILAPGARTFIPSLNWAINELINPKLLLNGIAPIRIEEIYRFYWDFYAGFIEKLYPKLQYLAEIRVDEAFDRRGW